MRKMIEIPSLNHSTYFSVKKVAKESCGQTSDMLAEKIGMSKSHLNRHFSDPEYNIQTPMLPTLCLAMNNFLQIEWQVVQIGGTMSIVNPGNLEDMNVDSQVSKTMTEAADVLKVWSDSMLDGVRTVEESAALEAQLTRLIRKATECRETLKMGVRIV